MSVSRNNNNNSFSRFYHQNLQKNVAKSESYKNNKNAYTNTLSGIITGSVVGIIDGYLTDKSRKKTIRKGLEEIKRYSFTEKKEFVKILNNSGISLKTYKSRINKVMNGSTCSEILKKVLIYSAILTGIGFIADLKHKHEKST